ncbi:hypothetical protein Bbelb_248230 [Branchiostoma belcheri]|nr:hypothetical protein Bbelb_248230 [Branchiostoma belcheri]
MLNLSRNLISAFPWESLKHTPHLGRLDLSNNLISAIRLDLAIDGPKSLWMVNIAYNKLTTFSPANLGIGSKTNQTASSAGLKSTDTDGFDATSPLFISESKQPSTVSVTVQATTVVNITNSSAEQISHAPRPAIINIQAAALVTLAIGSIFLAILLLRRRIFQSDKE